MGQRTQFNLQWLLSAMTLFALGFAALRLPKDVYPVVALVPLAFFMCGVGTLANGRSGATLGLFVWILEVAVIGAVVLCRTWM